MVSSKLLNRTEDTAKSILLRGNGAELLTGKSPVEFLTATRGRHQTSCCCLVACGEDRGRKIRTTIQRKQRCMLGLDRCWKSPILSMVLRIKTGETAHRYRRLWRRPKDSGTLPLKRLLERSKAWSFGSSPSSGGSPPDMLLFCNNLKKDGSRVTHAEETGIVFLRIEMSSL